MSRRLRWYRLRWPRQVEPAQLVTISRALAASHASPIVLEAIGHAGRVEHQLGLPETFAGALGMQLRAALPGLGLERLLERSTVISQRAVSLVLSSRRRPLRSDDLPALATALLTALAHVGRDEALVLQWILGGHLLPAAVSGDTHELPAETWLGAFMTAAWTTPQRPDAEALRATRAKRGEPGWRAVGRIAVAATGKTRQRQLIRQVLGALRTADAPGIHVRARSVCTPSLARPPWRWPLRLNALELAALSSWPVGSTSQLPVVAEPSRRLAPAAAIPRSGRVIGQSNYAGLTRPLALAPTDSLRHLHVLGPTGTGKSTLLLNLITADMSAGRGVVVIEPQGDLVARVLERVPARRLDDVVVLDPSSDDERVVGFNPLHAGGRKPELVADQLLSVFHRLYAASWGPRTHDILGAALLTLARTPGMTLVALPLLLSDAGFRRRLVSRLHDPLGLGPFWASFEGWSEAQRIEATAPVLNKVRPFLLRPQLRAILGQAQPRFALQDVFTKRRIVLVNLAKGLVGPEAAALFGALIVTQLWQAVLERAAVAAERRHPVFIYLDEFGDFLRLPTELDDALSQSRSHGVAWTLAHQFLDQLDRQMQRAVLANARSRVCFQLEHADARALATGSSELEAEDFQGLGSFEVLTQLVAGGAVQPWCSGRTLPPSEAGHDAGNVRQRSLACYGLLRAEVEAALTALVSGKTRASGADDLAPRQRGSRP